MIYGEPDLPVVKKGNPACHGHANQGCLPFQILQSRQGLN
jgi:hypothetical protein